MLVDEGFLEAPNVSLPVSGITLSGTGFKGEQYHYFSLGPLVCYQSKHTGKYITSFM